MRLWKVRPIGSPNHNAIIFYGSSLTYKQLDRKVNQFAHALRRMGVKPGDRVMIVLPNVPQMGYRLLCCPQNLC